MNTSLSLSDMKCHCDVCCPSTLMHWPNVNLNGFFGLKFVVLDRELQGNEL